MRKARRAVAVFTLILSAILTCNAVSNAPLPALGTKFAQVANLAHYDTSDGHRSTMKLHNRTRDPITVTPTIYASNGQLSKASSLVVPGNESLVIEIHDLIVALAPSFVKGSLRLDFETVTNGLSAELIVQDSHGHIAASSYTYAQQRYKGTVLQGLWWSPDDDYRMVVSVLNTTDNKVSSLIILTRADGSELKSSQVELGPHETRELKLRDLGVQSGKFGGITLS